MKRLALILARLCPAALAQSAYPPAPKAPLGWQFFAVNGLQFGAAALDIESTQKCIRDRRCFEGNPLVPENHLGAYAVSFSVAGIETWGAYYFKRHRNRLWWSPPSAGTGFHLVGAVHSWRIDRHH